MHVLPRRRMGAGSHGHKDFMAGGEPADAATVRDGETEDMLPAPGVQAPPTLHRVSRRPLGLAPVPLLGALLVAAVLLGIVLLALGAWLGGIVLLACALGLLALLLVAVEQEPDDPAASAAVTAAGRARSQTRLIGVAARAWSAAGLSVVRLSQRRYHLRWKLRRQLQPLGEAAYRGDEHRVELLKAQVRRIEEALHEADRESSEVLGAARAEVERERAPVKATEVLPAQPPAQKVLKQP